MAAAAQLLQLCPTLCDPINGSPPGSPIPGILQARTPERVFKAQCALNYIHTEVLLFLTADDQYSNCSTILRPLSSIQICK